MISKVSLSLRAYRHLSLVSLLLALLVLQGCAGSRELALSSGAELAELDAPHSPSELEEMVTNAKRPYVTGYYNKSPIQCVPFAREASGFDIYGDAYTWWDQAPQKGYAQGAKPAKGAVMVLKKGRKLSRGHLAVVTDILNEREIEVSHSNWGDTKKTRSYIYKSMRVQDISPKNDWSIVSFWNKYYNQYGLPYKNNGFIYPHQQMAMAQ